MTAAPKWESCDGSNECQAERHLHGCYSDDGSNCDHPSEHEAAAAPIPQVERDVVTVRAQLDYPHRGMPAYREALEALDRLAATANEADRLIAQHEVAGGAS